MTMRLATDALQGPTGRADALGVATDCADADDGVGENAIDPPIGSAPASS